MTLLHTGWVEQDSIRCMYHGWRYDGDGRCVERPAEPRGSEAGVRIKAYPVHEYAGVVFAYMADGPTPEFELPRKVSYEQPDVLLFARSEIWPCNWLQHVENSLDAVHVSFAHQAGVIGAFGEAISTELPALAFTETEAGMRQVATRRIGGKVQVRTSDWTFPNCNHVNIPGLAPGDPWIEIVHWFVPIDDILTLRLAAFCTPSTTPERNARLREYFEGCADYNASAHHRDLFAGRYPSDPLVRLTSAQDYVALAGQGTVADRLNERLGHSDGGVVLLRRLLERELNALAAGGETKRWRRLDKPSVLLAQSQGEKS